jgi:hypothetical protein
MISGLLRRLWRSPLTPHPFRSLSTLTEYWTNETLDQIEQWPDMGLVRAGLQLFEELPRNATRKVLLATHLRAGNVLRAELEPWLVIALSRSWEIRLGCDPSTCSIVEEDCDWIRTEQFEALQTLLESNTNV